MMPEQPDLRHLRYFVGVAEELHFGRAARRLGIQQPPLSQQIQRLEAMIGTRLFVRRPNTRLTEAGRALLEPARRLLRQAAHALDGARRAALGEVGPLDIGFAASTLPLGLARAIRQFRRKMPDIELRLHEMPSAAQPDALREGRIDLGILREPAHEEGIAWEEVMTEELVAVLPPGHRLARRKRMPLGALAGEWFVHFPRAVAPGLFDRIALLCRTAGFLPDVAQEAREWLTIVGLVEAGLGVALAPSSYRQVRWGAVRYVSLSTPRERMTSVGLCSRVEDRSPAAERFAQIVRDRLAPSRRSARRSTRSEA